MVFFGASRTYSVAGRSGWSAGNDMAKIQVPYASATTGAAARDEITKVLRRFGCESVGFMDDLPFRCNAGLRQYQAGRLYVRAGCHGAGQSRGQERKTSLIQLVVARRNWTYRSTRIGYSFDTMVQRGQMPKPKCIGAAMGAIRSHPAPENLRCAILPRFLLERGAILSLVLSERRTFRDDV